MGKFRKAALTVYRKTKTGKIPKDRCDLRRAAHITATSMNIIEDQLETNGFFENERWVAVPYVIEVGKPRTDT